MAVRLPLIGIVLLMTLGAATSLPRQRSASRPASKPSIATDIHPDAKPLLDSMDKAYGLIKSIELAGTIAADIDAGGDRANDNLPFTSRFLEPNFFRHELGDDLVICTGQTLYVYSKPDNMYVSAPAPRTRIVYRSFPAVSRSLLRSQNLSLLLAVTSQAADVLKHDCLRISREPDIEIDRRKSPALRLEYPSHVLTLILDGESHLIRRAMYDFRKELESAGRKDVKHAWVTVDYRTIRPDAAIEQASFAWPPPSAPPKPPRLQRRATIL